jgi:catechol 2,3-dioxygenase-like lactoylglutathione lyase family enzyme
MKLVGIHHVAVCVPDVDRAVAFYCDVLGLEQLSRPSEIGPGAWLQAGAQQVHLMQRQEAPLKSQHFALQVEDLESAIADLEAVGVSVKRLDPTRGAGRQALLFDPAGNGIELNEPTLDD